MNATACRPGEVLAQKLAALGLTATKLVWKLHVPANRITQIVNGKRTVTGYSALLLTRWFGEYPEQCMAFQARYDLKVAKTKAGGEVAEPPTRPHPSASLGKRQTKPVQGRAA